ncbi:MAG: helix-turn-helix domain-containing protein [Parashewanella sp.]
MSISLAKVGQRIVRYRKNKGIKQVQLAEAVGISKRTLSKIENGHDSQLSVLMAIADALEIDISQITSGLERKPHVDPNYVSVIEHYLESIENQLGLIRKLINS